MIAMQKNNSPTAHYDHQRSAAEHSAQGQPAPRATVAPYFRWKIVLDFVLAAFLLVIGLPVMAVLVLLVRLTSRGPGIYRQSRVGKNGRPFMMYKIRTMRQDAESGTGPVWTQHTDPRVTLVGRVLRKLHLDELPQLVNVLKGEMSLVGPRPERPEFVRVLAEALPHYRDRLAVRPGVTGLAQMNLPPDSDLTSVERKLVLDCEYITHGGLWMDIRLLACTLLRMFKVSERWLLYVLGLARSVKIPAPSQEHAPEGGNGAVEAAATPASILFQAASESASHEGNGSHRSNESLSSNASRSHGSNGSHGVNGSHRGGPRKKGHRKPGNARRSKPK